MTPEYARFFQMRYFSKYAAHLMYEVCDYTNFYHQLIGKNINKLI